MRQLLFALVLLLSLGGYSQENYHFIPRGMHFSIGPFSAVPTNNVLFPQQYADADDIVHQPMLKEWYSPGLGGFVDMSYNFGERRPFQVGGSFRWQRLFKGKDDYTRVLFPDQEIDWKYRRNVRYFNVNLFADYSQRLFGNIHAFGRGEIGLGIYRMKNKFNWELDSEDRAEYGPRIRETDFVLSGELAAGVRWLFNHSSSLSLSVGYQLQGINDFIRRDYMSSLQGHLTEDHYYPEDGDFYETSDYSVARPPRVKNEFLYIKLGITHQITSGDLRNFLAEKPVLYLYPEDIMDVNVQIKLHRDHKIAYDYPKYNSQDGWNVSATPNGMMRSNNRDYYCLFWETEGPAIAENLTEGFIVSKENAQAFLEEKLEKLGLNNKEANEFIIYWLPKFEQSPYTAVHFASDAYENVSQLLISPKPDQIIRVMMLMEPLAYPISLKEQELPERPVRKGFTAVEWGGSQGEFFQKNHLIE